MNLKKLPPAMLLTLDLVGCKLSACLSPGYESELPPSTDTGPGSTGGTGTGTGSTGSADESTFGACLGMLPPETSTGIASTGGSESGSGSGSSGSGSGTDTGGTETDGASTGMEAPPSETRAEALRRVLERGALPADLAARLSVEVDDG